jgi:hypothetical protein
MLGSAEQESRALKIARPKAPPEAGRRIRILSKTFTILEIADLQGEVNKKLLSIVQLRH